MKLVLFFLCLTQALFGNLTLLNPDHTPKEALLELAKLTDLNLEDSLVAPTQAHWLRGKHLERWQIEARYEEKASLMRPYFEQLQLFEEIAPAKTHYTYGLVLGATMPRVRIRLATLVKWWNEGIRFDTLVFLGGKRPLDPNIENAQVLLDADNKTLPFRKDWIWNGTLPTNETEMMQLAYDQSDLPKELLALPVTFIDAPMQGDSRPTTQDTLIMWLNTKPNPGPEPYNCLFVSNQPYIGYQNSVIKKWIPYPSETIGCGTTWDLLETQNGKALAPLLLDTLARWLKNEVDYS